MSPSHWLTFCRRSPPVDADDDTRDDIIGDDDTIVVAIHLARDGAGTCQPVVRCRSSCPQAVDNPTGVRWTPPGCPHPPAHDGGCVSPESNQFQPIKGETTYSTHQLPTWHR